MDQIHYLYVLHCSDGSYYVGTTQDLKHRLRAHNEGRATLYTARRRPLRLVYSENHDSIEAARQRELQIKRWTRKKKEALIRGDVSTLKVVSRRRVS